MSGPEDVLEAQRLAWAKLAAGWEKWDSVIMDQLRPVGDAIIQHLNIKDEQQHIDIASGTGEPGLSIAELAPDGRIFLTDLAEEMLGVAARSAHARGISNIETVVCSADRLPFESATFDSVSVRFGYMFFPDLTKATEEFARVLKPGGRLCSSVWVKPEENPWTSIFVQALAEEEGIPGVDPDGPNMFRCAAPRFISSLYEHLGLRDVQEWDVSVELVTESTDEYWEMISAHMSLAVAALQSIDKAGQQRIKKRVITSAMAYEKGGMVRVPGLARCIVGTK